MILVQKNIGAWCNGNTWVSKTFVVSSNLTAPATYILCNLLPQVALFLCSLANDTPHLFEGVPEEIDVDVVSNGYIGVSEKF